MDGGKPSDSEPWGWTAKMLLLDCDLLSDRIEEAFCSRLSVTQCMLRLPLPSHSFSAKFSASLRLTVPGCPIREICIKDRKLNTGHLAGREKDHYIINETDCYRNLLAFSNMR